METKMIKQLSNRRNKEMGIESAPDKSIDGSNQLLNINHKY